jgi:hypothetical protein
MRISLGREPSRLNPTPAVRRLFLIIAVLLLLALAWTGLTSGVHDLSVTRSTGQKVQAVAQVTYGFLSVLAVVTVFRGRRWQSPILRSWAVSLTLAAGLASVVWGGTTIAIGLLSAAVALLAAMAIGWLLRVGTRGLTSA